MCESDARPDFACQEPSDMDQNTSVKLGGISEVIRTFVFVGVVDNASILAVVADSRHRK